MKLNFHLSAGSELPSEHRATSERLGPLSRYEVTQTLKNWSDIGQVCRVWGLLVIICWEIFALSRGRDGGGRSQDRFDARSPEYPSDVLFVGHEM